jgi:hypothetical protein
MIGLDATRRASLNKHNTAAIDHFRQTRRSAKSDCSRPSGVRSKSKCRAVGIFHRGVQVVLLVGWIFGRVLIRRRFPRNVFA